MELVSANTKNYLFLTLTQNNEQDELVRARVSMRRDQSFWEGGNSFIACESFRITSAPNAGGLYYQQVPEDFVISANRVTGHSDPDNAFDDLEETTPPFGYMSAGVARVGDKLVSKDVAVKKGKTNTLTATLQLAKGDSTSLDETKFEDLVPRVSRYIGQSRVSRNSILEFTDTATDAVKVLLTSEPQHTFQGPGLGSNGLFVPLVSFPNGAMDFQNKTNRYFPGASVKFEAVSGFNLSSSYTDLVTQMVANCGFIHASGSPGGFHGAFYADGAVFQIMRPRGMECTIPEATDVNGFLVAPLFWDNAPKLPKEGDPCHMYINGALKRGKITSTGDIPQLETPTSFIWQLDIQQTANNAGAANQHQLTGAIMAANEFCAASIGTKLSMNYNFTISGTVQGNDLDIGAVCNTIKLARKTINSTVAVSRGGRAVTVYTPNELFHMFNNSGDGALTPPWLLQTDENGGFTVQWNMTTDNVCTDFSISKAMCDSLGLNAWMDYEQVQSTQKTHKYMVTLLDTAYRDLEDTDNVSFTNFVKDVPISEVFHGVPPDGPLIPVTDPNAIPPTVANWTYMDQVTYNGVGHYILSIQGTETDVGEGKRTRLIPDLVDVNGVQMYRYSGLPNKGQIHNDGQISVESWGTFSMINLVIPNIPFQSMLGGQSDARILASLRLPFQYTTSNDPNGAVSSTGFSYYGDLLFNSDSSRSYLRITTDQQLFDCDVEARLIRRDGSMEIMQIPYKGQFQVKLRLLQTQ